MTIAAIIKAPTPRRVISPALLCLAALLWALPALAQGPARPQADGALMQVFDDFEVHYMVFNSTFMQPEVASRYGIVRARNGAVVNVAVRRKQEDGSTRGQRAIVRGTHSDLIHRHDLQFQEVIEGDAIYYIAELRFAGRSEERHFELQIQPDRDRAPYTLRFSRTLYRD